MFTYLSFDAFTIFSSTAIRLFAGFEDQHTEEMFESAYPEIKTDYSILHNQFYHDERLRIYNYTAYQTD